VGPFSPKLFAVTNPIVELIVGSSGKQLPIAGTLSFVDEFCGAPIAQRKAGRIGIDASAAAVTHCESHPPFRSYINSVRALLFCGQSCARCVDLEVFMLVIKLCQSNHCGACHHAQRNTFVAQGNNAQDRTSAQAHKIAGIDLQLYPSVAVSSYSVALHHRIVEPSGFPIGIAFSF
jgi:hypothetical protein